MAKYFECGDLKMPSIGLGTWQDEALEKALDFALEAGYRHIDTAFAYNNEAIIGRVLKRWFESGKLNREDIFVTSKCPLQGLHPDRIEIFLKKSLESLQLEYVDLYLTHFTIGIKPTPDGTENLTTDFEDPTDHIAIWKKLEEQVQAGRTKTIGLSNYNIRQIKRILENSKIPPANVQVELHVFLQQPELVKFCHDNNISVVAYSPLAVPGYKDKEKWGQKQTREYPDALNDPTVLAIAKKHGKANSQVLLRFLLQRNIAVIPRSVSPARIKQNLQLFDFSLDEEDMERLRKLDQGENGRIRDFKQLAGVENHAEYPFK